MRMLQFKRPEDRPQTGIPTFDMAVPGPHSMELMKFFEDLGNCKSKSDYDALIEEHGGADALTEKFSENHTVIRADTHIREFYHNPGQGGNRAQSGWKTGDIIRIDGKASLRPDMTTVWAGGWKLEHASQDPAFAAKPNQGNMVARLFVQGYPIKEFQQRPYSAPQVVVKVFGLMREAYERQMIEKEEVAETPAVQAAEGVEAPKDGDGNASFPPIA